MAERTMSLRAAASRKPAGSAARAPLPAAQMQAQSPREAELFALADSLNNRPPIHQLRALGAGLSAPVQRVVLSKVLNLSRGGTRTEYYSTLDRERRTFENLDEAQARDDDLRLRAAPLDRSARYPTGFTYRDPGDKPATTSHNIISDSNAGPHSLSHSSTAYRLTNAFEAADFNLRALRDQQVPTPEQYAVLYQKTKGGKVRASQELRANTDYRLLWDRLDGLIAANPTDNGDEAYELIMRLMQMNPYTAYGKATLGKRALQHKGERQDDYFEDAFDPNTEKTFGGDEEFRDFRDSRRKLWPEAERGSRFDLPLGTDEADDEEEEDTEHEKRPLKVPRSGDDPGSEVHSRSIREEIEAQQSIFTNNCLINAICRQAHHRDATFEELIQIRSNLGNVGEMMHATVGTLGVIRTALGIANPIVVYQGSAVEVAEDFAGDGAPLSIHHQGDVLHFEPGVPPELQDALENVDETI
ncbi:MAG TPA: hypothetical protein VFG62_26410 [Rhodopila sp.]|nr:hypothetical protein [Rhodopila sp.]